MEVLLFIKGCESLWNIYLSLISAAPSLSPVTLKMNTVNKTLLPFYNVVCLHCIDFEWIRNFSNPQTRCFECQFFLCFSFWSFEIKKIIYDFNSMYSTFKLRYFFISFRQNFIIFFSIKNISSIQFWNSNLINIWLTQLKSYRKYENIKHSKNESIFI